MMSVEASISPLALDMNCGGTHQSSLRSHATEPSCNCRSKIYGRMDAERNELESTYGSSVNVIVKS